jgi:hypothetical protein
MTAAYIRFAAARRPLFEVLYDAGLDKARCGPARCPRAGRRWYARHAGQLDVGRELADGSTGE